MASNSQSTSTDLDEDDESGIIGPRNQHGLTHQPSASSRLHAVPPVQGAEKRKLRRVKKPQEMPSRPLSAYNLFFKDARIEWLAEADQVAALEQDEDAAAARDPPRNPDGTRKRRKSRLFEKMAKEIGRRWKELTPTRKRKYEGLAEVDKQRYRREMNEYQEKLIGGKEEKGSKEAKSKKLKKASFQQEKAREEEKREENSDDEKKPRARPGLSSNSTNVSEPVMLSSQHEISSLPSSSRYNDETGSAPSSQEGSMDLSSNLGSNVQHALLAVLDNQRRDEELRLMAAAAVARQLPPNPPVNWQELLSISNVLNGNNALRDSQVLTEGTQASASAAAPINYHGFLQERQRLGALASSYAQGNQHVSQEDRFPTVVPLRASYSLSDQHQPEDGSSVIEMLLQQELQRRSQISTQNPSTMLLEQSRRQEQFEAFLRSQQRHQAQGFDSTTSTQSLLEQELQRLSSNAPESFSSHSGRNVASLGASAGQGQGQQPQNYNPTNPYEVMALLSYLSQQEQHDRSSQGQYGSERDQQE